jgi:hypothetical protein
MDKKNGSSFHYVIQVDQLTEYSIQQLTCPSKEGHLPFFPSLIGRESSLQKHYSDALFFLWATHLKVHGKDSVFNRKIDLFRM